MKNAPIKILIADDNNADQQKEGSFHQILLVFRNPMILRLAAIYFLLKPTRYAILFWGPLIVYERLGGNIGQSALISAVFEAAGPIGVIFFGYSSDKWFQARRMPAVISDSSFSRESSSPSAR